MVYDDTNTTEFFPIDDQVRFVDDVTGQQFRNLYLEDEAIGPKYDDIRAMKQGETRPIEVDVEGWPLAVFDDYGEFLDPSQRFRARPDGTILRNRNGDAVRAVDNITTPRREVPTRQMGEPRDDVDDDNKLKTWLPLIIIGGILAVILAMLLGFYIGRPSGDSVGTTVTPNGTHQEQQQEPETVTRTVEAEPETETETTTVRPDPIVETETVTETATETTTETATITETEIVERNSDRESGNREPTENENSGFLGLNMP